MDNTNPPAVSNSTRWDTNLKRIVLIGVVIGGIVLFYISRSVIPNLVMAAILAYLIHPVVNRAQHAGRHKENHREQHG